MPKKETAGTGIEAKARKEIAELLGAALGDTYALLVKTHVYHWNVTGRTFFDLHEMLEMQYKDLFEATDVIAERIRQLGSKTPTSFSEMLAAAAIKEETADRSAEEMVANLLADHETISRSLREMCEQSDDAKDVVTTDMLTQRLAAHEKAAWMLRATLG